MSGSADTWTAEMKAALVQLWRDGLTAAEIGRRLGVTKNAVLGRVHRMGLAGRPSPIKRAHGALPLGKRIVQSQRPKAPPKPKLAETGDRDDPLPDIRRAKPRQDYAEMPTGNAQCRWPIGHPGEPDYRTCTDKAIQGKPYCALHSSLAYVQVKPKAAGEAA